MRIVVVGATGNVGTSLISALECDPEVTSIDTDVLVLADVRAAADLQELLVRDGYWIPVREQTKAVGVAPNVHGVTINPYGATVLYDAWITDTSS